MKLAWITDVHLDLASAPEKSRLFSQVRAWNVDAIMITGDIATAEDIEQHLKEIARSVERPVYFVLGNHDFYGGSIPEVRERVGRLARDSSLLFYMTDLDFVELTSRCAIIGHDGWGDAGFGNMMRSPVIMQDFFVIEELRIVPSVYDMTPEVRRALGELLHELGREAAEHYRRVLPRVLDRYEQVIVLSHVPPFLEASWHQGNHSDEDWAPMFTCRQTGEVLREMAEKHPRCQITAYCGHTHSPGEAWLRPNLCVRTGLGSHGDPLRTLQPPIYVA